MQGQEDFVRNYAAKRAAQMERARALREQREAQRDGGTGPASAPAHSGGHHPQHQQPSYQAPPSQATQFGQQQRQRQQPEPARQPPPQQPRAAFDYPPPVQQHQQPQPQAVGRRTEAAPRSVAPAQTRPSAGPAAAPAGGAGQVSVTETDFQRAVALGVISTEQARQLWTVVSSGAAAPSPAYAGYASAAPAPSANAGGHTSTSTYDPNMFAPGSAPGPDPRRAQQPPMAEPQRQSVSSSNRRPEWNDDYADPAPGLQRDDSDTNYAPPSRPVGSGQTPSRASRSQIPQQQQQRGSGAGDWNSDFAEPADGGFGAPPPVPGRRRPKVVKDDPPEAGTAPTDFDSMPVGRGAGGPPKDPYADAYPDETPSKPPTAAKKSSLAPGAAARVAAGRRATPARGQQREQPEPVEYHAPPPPGDELEEMERQKEEAKMRLEQELREAEQAAANEPMEECRVCGRSFRAGIIDRHEKACQVSSKKRRAFDTKSQRLADGAEEVRPSRGATKVDAKKAAEKASGKMPKWKVQHEQFQAAMQAVKGVRDAEATGAPMPAMPARSAPDDRVPCPYCNRKFAEDVAERHIPKCKQTINRPRAVGARR